MHPFARTTIALLALCITTTASAQTITGTITGIVRDASGGVLPGATVTLTHLQTTRHETAISDAEGRYTSVPLPLGDLKRASRGSRVRFNPESCSPWATLRASTSRWKWGLSQRSSR